MVIIENEYIDRYGIWMDGNEPHAGAVRILTSRPKMDELGIADEIRIKHNLMNYRVKDNMCKTDLWKHLLSAQLEQELVDAGVDPDEFDGFLLKPQSARADSSYAALARGVRPSNDRRRISGGHLANQDELEAKFFLQMKYGEVDT